jgi:hypothetical protein
MSLVLPPRPHSESAPLAWPLHRLSVALYHRLTETGVLTEDDNIELLEGWIIERNSKNPPHDS